MRSICCKIRATPLTAVWKKEEVNKYEIWYVNKHVLMFFPFFLKKLFLKKTNLNLPNHRDMSKNRQQDCKFHRFCNGTSFCILNHIFHMDIGLDTVKINYKLFLFSPQNYKINNKSNKLKVLESISSVCVIIINTEKTRQEKNIKEEEMHINHIWWAWPSGWPFTVH